MTIAQAGDYWKGSEAADLEPFIKGYEAGGQPVTTVVTAVCTCGSRQFEVTVSDDEDAARRRCVRCGDERLMLDSDRRWDEDDDPDECACPCEGEVFDVAVGFARAGNHHDGAITWASVGLRCIECGTLGVYADWKVDPAASAQLTEKV